MLTPRPSRRRDGSSAAGRSWRPLLLLLALIAAIGLFTALWPRPSHYGEAQAATASLDRSAARTRMLHHLNAECGEIEKIRYAQGGVPYVLGDCKAQNTPKHPVHDPFDNPCYQPKLSNTFCGRNDTVQDRWRVIGFILWSPTPWAYGSREHVPCFWKIPKSQRENAVNTGAPITAWQTAYFWLRGDVVRARFMPWRPCDWPGKYA